VKWFLKIFIFVNRSKKKQVHLEQEKILENFVFQFHKLRPLWNLPFYGQVWGIAANYYVFKFSFSKI
jgi:hypothetical protein